MAEVAMRGWRRVLGGLAAFGLAGAWLAVSAPSATAQDFKSDGTFTVPAGVCQVTIAAWGGSGDTGDQGGFGVGGQIQANFAVTGPQVLQVFVGLTGDGGFNHGGSGAGDGGNGGGSSAVLQGSTVLILAGGGGGGGASDDGGNGGVATSAGPSDAGSGKPGKGAGAGTGGTAQGTPNVGGDASSDGGGGGAGADPGTGATGAATTGGGGGGGNLSTSTAGLLNPGGQVPFDRDGKVTITSAAPGVGCPTTPTTAPAAAPTAVVVTPRFTG
jgi:hypothetical protein